MKNKEITIYKLIGLIKDGKAPKKIEYRGIIYDFDEKINDYYNSDKKIWSFLYHILGKIKDFVNEFLNDTVEILPEENDEWEDIKELNNNFTFEDTICELTNNDYKISCLSKKINKLIKNQKYLKERLEDNTCIKTKTELCNLIDERIEEKLESQQGPFMDEIRIDTPKWIEDPKKKEKLDYYDRED